ncbi:MAG: protein-L-isoaspartate O-methyltransferase [Sulfurovum sp.]|uniref:protein-L-isoaspartate O-methyltransferase n=1 Tax=Sulfurovum sp. TaxID=1969726 RepID=UPI002867E184|nr:protein-L-isoaspartate O-methyltransferase [Sulfurovum sp.]MCO4844444.1 protein-L-isoaspartate O-methyltransferase [Sulfurovum sp.]
MKTMDLLVDDMIFSNMLKSPHIIDAFRAVDRKYFVPASFAEHTYIDAPIPIGNSQTISQPSTVAFMLEQLAPQKGDKVLDIGSGSGWTTALLCHIVGEKGSVTGVERVDALVEQGRDNLSKFNFNHCFIKQAGEKLGLPGEQFDRILVSAAADEIPEELFLQLKIGGTLVIPVENSIYKFKKVSEEDIKIEEFYGFVFVPLIY